MPDLFPETLVVALVHGQPMTDSLAVAEHFGKRHDNVLRKVAEVECSERFRRLNFEAANYLDQQKKPRQMWRMSKDGFWLLAMGFTGAEAARWREAFIDAFNNLESELAAANARYLAALDAIRPSLRPVVKDFEDGLPRSDTALWLGKSPAAVTYHRSQARRLGLLPAVATRRLAREGGAA